MADVQARDRINLNSTDAAKAKEITGGKTGVEMVRELMEMAEHPPVGHVPNGNNGMAVAVNPPSRSWMNRDQSEANVDISLERKYWDMIHSRAKAIDAVLELKKKIAKVEPKEWAAFNETKRLGEITQSRDTCFICHETGHWSYDCPKKYVRKIGSESS